MYDPVGDRVRAETWINENGQLDRPGDLPAVIYYGPDGKSITRAEWHREGLPHRDGDKPAIIERDGSEHTITYEGYLVAGQFHRDGDKPAEINRYEDGSPSLFYFYRHGQLHRERGPARVSFSKENGKPDDQEFWQNGRQLLQSFPTPPGLEIT